jgi:hypothetical protein
MSLRDPVLQKGMDPSISIKKLPEIDESRGAIS